MRKALCIAAMVGVMVMPAAPAQASHDRFNVMVRADGTKALFPYLAQTGYFPRTGWVAGDRHGYRCAYAFLQVGGKIVGRVTFTRIEYAMINDRYMDEAERFYDGTPYHGPAHQLRYCPSASEAYVDADGPIGPLPVVTYTDTDTGALLEVRHFALVEQHGDGVPWKFQVVRATPRRVSILGYQEGEPAIAIYYDCLSPDVTLSSIGTG